MRDLSNIYNIGKRGVGRKLSKAGTYGPTRATAAAMYGADATHQDQEVRTKEFLDQLHSKKARERMRNR